MEEDLYSEIKDFYIIQDIDELVQKVFELHFDPKNGSRYWLDQLEKPTGKLNNLEFNPRRIDSYEIL